MTEPYYNCDLMPGMIADYSFDFDGEFPIQSYNHVSWSKEQLAFIWLSENLTGPFAFHFPSTAHWEMHVQVSNPNDVVIVKTFLSNVKHWTEHVSLTFEGKSRNIQQKKLTLRQLIQGYVSYHYVYFGHAYSYNSVPVRRKYLQWLKKYPQPVKYIHDELHHMYINTLLVEAQKKK